MPFSYRLKDIAEFLELELVGPEDAIIHSISGIGKAVAGDISFLAKQRYMSLLADCKATAMILRPAHCQYFGGACLLSGDPYLSYAKLSRWFSHAPMNTGTVHPSAVIASNSYIASGSSVGAYSVIGANVMIGENCYIGANTCIGERCSLGSNCYIADNVTLYHDVKLGRNVKVHSGAVIGADGFGFASDGAGRWEKIYQNGGVTVGDRVEIGANSTIDRGALDDTVVGYGVIIDDHVHIAHNASIGDNVAMAAYAAVAGSTIIGANCIFGGNSAVLGHLEIADNVHLTARTTVTKSIKESGSYSSSGFPLMESFKWRRCSVNFGKLEKIHHRVQKVEKGKD
ncbi:MAG: UDP-3-O-(3-hydroxymyristoyl)glucosamine N-acyltransferase [Porticoccaceae bacterium]|nr:UDP-3-O-(3-hydroxymyristoyl)glucosamine N-acyltransferase [Porticoccaceae bacterium]|tara:strand:+ start:19952 stop:20977 length:1026 start_codon:yes stop_codon:yes gene_type:complete